MKAKLITPPEPDKIVQIELTKDEAYILKALVGGIRSTGVGLESVKLTSGLYSELTRILEPGSGFLFADFFEGDVKCK